MSLTSGTRLGPYEILDLLGTGGMGEVWKARDTRLNRVVAVKRLTGQHGRFEQEARAIAALNHPHICQIYDVGPDYLVLEYVEGQTLAARLRSGRGPGLPLEEALRIARQIVEGLEEAHRSGILHRDLKPSNVMVTTKGVAKLLDFGLATLVSDDADVTRTQDGTVLGTAAYMSPEQAEGRPVDVEVGRLQLRCRPVRNALRESCVWRDDRASDHECRRSRRTTPSADLARDGSDRQAVSAEIAQPAFSNDGRTAGRARTTGDGAVGTGRARAVHRRSALRQRERREGERVFQRRVDRGDHQRARQSAWPESRWPHVVVLFPRKGCRVRRDRQEAQRRPHSGGERSQGGQPYPCHGAARQGRGRF